MHSTTHNHLCEKVGALATRENRHCSRAVGLNRCASRRECVFVSGCNRLTNRKHIWCLGDGGNESALNGVLPLARRLRFGFCGGNVRTRNSSRTARVPNSKNAGLGGTMLDFPAVWLAATVPLIALVAFTPVALLEFVPVGAAVMTGVVGATVGTGVARRGSSAPMRLPTRHSASPFGVASWQY
jgi:hypothetical protein